MEKEWFKHDYGTRNKKKLAVLLHEEGSRGYGLFWIIVEMLYEASAKKLELEDHTYLAIKKESGEPIDSIRQFIEKCISVYKVFKKSGKSYFTTERVLKNFKLRKEISKNLSEAGRKGGLSKSYNLAIAKQKLAGATENVANSSREEKRREEEKREEENAIVSKQEEGPPADLANSNLFRKPNIPTKRQVWEAFQNAGGDAEMAKSFWQKHQSTGWFINGSPIVDYISLAQRFIQNWKDMDGEKDPKNKVPEHMKSSGGPTLKTLP